MAQYKTGTVSVTNGSATVTGSGTLWSGEIAAGDLFTIVGDNAWYEVASVGSNTSLTLSANYAGTTGSGKSYAISRDFTTRLALPYPQKGDIETASIIKRAFEQIDTETNIATANYSATSAPTANDDSGDGYSIGSWWVNVTSDEAYLCVDATVGAAVWTKISVDVPSEIVALLAGQSVSMASLTLSGGTANGVLYLNGSKVATSGSALTFDGSEVFKNSGGTIQYNDVRGSAAAGTRLSAGGTLGTDSFDLFQNSSYGAVWNRANTPIAFAVNGSEAMRLTSTGLGVGTSSPGYKLETVGPSGDNIIALFRSGDATAANNAGGGFRSISSATAASRQAQIWLDADGANFGGGDYFYINKNGNSGTVDFVQYSNAAMRFYTNNTLQATLDSSGNLGLGVTPSAWGGSGYKAFQLGQSAFFSRPLGSDSYLLTNCYYNGTNFIYNQTAPASYYRQDQASHAWFYAASGTAGSTITFTQAMTLDASGNLLVGTTSSTGNGGKSQVVRTDAGACLYLETNNSSGSQNVLDITNAANAGMSNMIRFWVNGYGNTQVGSITTTTTSTAYNTSSDYRLKENQQALTGSGAFIDALKPKTWNWKSNGEKGVGFIAHEVQEVSPNSVVGEKDGEQMQAMEYGSAEFIANIIAELQSLRARVAALES